MDNQYNNVDSITNIKALTEKRYHSFRYKLITTAWIDLLTFIKF